MDNLSQYLKNLGIKSGETVYVPIPALTSKQALITHNFKIIRIVSLILLTVNLILGGVAAYNLAAFTGSQVSEVLAKETNLVSIILSLWVTCLSVSIIFDVAILTVQRLTMFSPKTGWGLLIDFPQPDKNPELLEKRIKKSALIGKSHVKKFKFIWLFTFICALIVLASTYLDFPRALLSSVVVFILSVVINGLLNFWLQFNFDDLKVLVGKFKAEEVKVEALIVLTYKFQVKAITLFL